jgi:hypothetical protein
MVAMQPAHGGSRVADPCVERYPDDEFARLDVPY